VFWSLSCERGVVARLVVVLAWLWFLTAFREDQWEVPSVWSTM
jgi:hypothetical protein